MRVSPTQYATALFELLSDAPAAKHQKLMQQFLNNLYNEGKLKILPDILRAVEQLDYAKKGVVPVTVTTARAIDAAMIQETLKSLMPNQATEVSIVIDESLIGGMRVETQDKRWDVSVTGQLKQLKNALTQSNH